MITRLLLLFLIICASPSKADDWESIIKAQDVEILVNLDSYNVVAGYPVMTTKSIFKKQQIEKGQKPYWAKVTTAQYNCAAHMVKPTQTILLDKKLNEIAKLAPAKQFSPVSSGTTDGQVETLVCQVNKMLGGA